MESTVTLEFIEVLEENRYRPTQASELFATLSTKEGDRLRLDIARRHDRESEPLVRCHLCKQPIFLKQHNDPTGKGTRFFSHYKAENDDTNCPQRTSSRIPQAVLEAIRERCTNESQRHRRLKQQIFEILTNDPGIPPESVQLDTRIKHSTWWRRPDVQAEVAGNLIAFEVQMPHQYASMIAEREWFYEESQTASILWVLPRFNPKEVSISERDVLASNNDHLFVLTEKMVEASLERQHLTIECWIHMPVLKGVNIEYEWTMREASLSELDFEGGHPFLVDTRAVEEALKIERKARIKKIRAQLIEKESAEAQAQAQLIDMTKRHGDSRDPFEVLVSDWRQIYDYLSERPFSSMREELLRDGFSLTQSRYTSGIWLKTRGIDWHEVECSPDIAMALWSAQNKRLMTPGRNWVWMTLAILQGNSDWLRPYHKLVRGIPEYRSYYHSSEELRATLKDSLNEPPLRDSQRDLLALLCPDLGIPEPDIVNPLELKPGRISYQINVQAVGTALKVASPEFTDIETKVEQRDLLSGITFVRNLIKDRIESNLKRNIPIPMPNLRTAFADEVTVIDIEPSVALIRALQQQCDRLKGCLIPAR